MSVVLEILNGYKNYFIGGDSVINEEAEKRASICSNCPLSKKGLHAALLPDMSIDKIEGLYCTDCGCPLSAKVRSKTTDCPKGKW
ncbi:hypothetical protein [Tenacibaculum sp. 190524A02b]|uniref:hypothetical protein n=1 Tax=Tenacibaculum vairaonense TaxID=3137860 RepID=UPI0031FACC2E